MNRRIWVPQWPKAQCSRGRSGWHSAGVAIAQPAPSRDLTRITLSVLGIGLLIGGSLWVLLPFLSALLWATMIVVSTWPFMLRLQERFGGRRGAAVGVMTAVLLLVLFVPLYLAVSTIAGQSDRIVDLAREIQTKRRSSWAWMTMKMLTSTR